MNIYDAILEDHERLRDLASKLEETEGASERREQLFAEFKEALIQHARVEEMTLYAELMNHEAALEQTRHSIAEHKDALDILEDVEDKDMSSPGWLLRFKTLAHDNEHHMTEEEEDVFPLARELLSDSDARSLGEQYQKENEEG